jgi:hypothetical protein
LITETLRGPQAGCLRHDISDSALKVVLSYYPVCRCQRTSPDIRRGQIHAHSGDKKTQSCADIYFVSENQGRDKIECNLQSQMYKNDPESFRGPRQAGLKISL